MKNSFRLLLIFFVLSLALSILFGCNGNEKKPEDTLPNSEPSQDQVESQIAVSSLSDYSIVIPKDSTDITLQAAVALKNAIEDKYGILLSVAADEYRFFARDKSIRAHEFLIGRTNRTETAVFLKTIDSDDKGFALYGEKLVICGATEELTSEAMDLFLNQLSEGEVFFSSQKNRLIQGSTVSEKKEVLIEGIPLSDYQIMHLNDASSIIAERMYQVLAEKSGVCLPVVRTTIMDTDNPVPSILCVCADKLDKKLAEALNIGDHQYGYAVTEWKGVPMIIVDGSYDYAQVLAANKLASDLTNGTELKKDTVVKKEIGIPMDYDKQNAILESISAYKAGDRQPEKTDYEAVTVEATFLFTNGIQNTLFNIVQGNCFDGENYYVAFTRTYDGKESGVIGVFTKDGEYVKESPELDIHHANAISNMGDGTLLISDYDNESGRKGWTLLDKETLTIIMKGQNDFPFLSLDYCKEVGLYASCGDGYGLHGRILDAKKNVIFERDFTVDPKSGPQNFFCTPDKIYATRYIYDAEKDAFTNYVYEYSWTFGLQKINYFETDAKLELQSVSVVDGKVYAVCGNHATGKMMAYLLDLD